MKNGFFCLENNGITTVYGLELINKDLKEYLKSVNEKYRTMHTFEANETMYGGRFDPSMYDRPGVVVVDHKILSTSSENYPPELLMYKPIGGPVNCVVEITQEFTSQIYKTIMNTFFDYRYGTSRMINLTNIIKLYNKINDLPNSFIYDRTLEKKDTNEMFTSELSYKNRLKEKEQEFNNPIELSDKDCKMQNDEITAIIETIFNSFSFNALGTIPNEEPDFEIMRRFGKRNSTIMSTPFASTLTNKLQTIPNNSNGNVIIADLAFDLEDEFDLDGKKEDRRIKKEIRAWEEQSAAHDFIRKAFSKKKDN